MTMPATPQWTATPSPNLQINSVAISPDGALSLCGTSNEFGTGQFGMYCYHADGSPAWQQAVTGPDATQGVFWVALSADSRFAAAGGESGKGVGFLTVCDAANGQVLLNVQSRLPGRVNQVSFSADGTLLLAAFANALQLYGLQADGTFAYLSSFPVDARFTCLSAVMAGKGGCVWVAALDYTTKPFCGLVECLEVRNGQFGIVTKYALGAGAMRVAATVDGMYAAAALHTGECALFSVALPGAPVWTFGPPGQTLGLAYGIDITQTQVGKLVVACGTNQPAGGYVYVVDSLPSSSPTQWTPQLRWIMPLKYSANPGISLDLNADLVTATDGQPTFRRPDGTPVHARPGASAESPGNFYLFDGAAGGLIWSYATPVMNWPMVITPGGTAVLGGSDDGTLYFW